MFLDDEFYLILKSNIDDSKGCSVKVCNELNIIMTRKIINVIHEHLQREVLSKSNCSDKNLLTICTIIDKQFKAAIHKLNNEGINEFKESFVEYFFKEYHPEIASALY